MFAGVLCLAIKTTFVIKTVFDCLDGGLNNRTLLYCTLVCRGFVKYNRATYQYRDAKTRQKDWKEIYNHKIVKDGLKTQAARCMDCGVPFCQSEHGCPLGNIIPKWNDLVFKVRNISTKAQTKSALELLFHFASCDKGLLLHLQNMFQFISMFYAVFKLDTLMFSSRC